MTTNRTDFLSLFPNASAAVEFENQVLSIGRDLLPPAAVAVLDGAEPTADYWAFLASQVEAQ